MQEYDLTGKVIGIAMEVHRELGFGYLEKVYENALVVLLEERGFRVERQVPIHISFHGHVIGDYIADLVVESRLIVELKAVQSLSPIHSAQLVNYLTATGIEDGLLLNFGATSLQFKRRTRTPPISTNSVNSVNSV